MTGKQLKAIRKSLRWTQAKVAATVGVSVNTVARWERGEVPISEPAARLIKSTGEIHKGAQMQSNLSQGTAELTAESFEKTFPTAAGRKVAALTRKQESVSLQINELSKKIESTDLRDSIAGRKLVKKFVTQVKEFMRISDQLKRGLDHVAAKAAESGKS